MQHHLDWDNGKVSTGESQNHRIKCLDLRLYWETDSRDFPFSQYATSEKPVATVASSYGTKTHLLIHGTLAKFFKNNLKRRTSLWLTPVVRDDVFFLYSYEREIFPNILDIAMIFDVLRKSQITEEI